MVSSLTITMFHRTGMLIRSDSGFGRCYTFRSNRTIHLNFVLGVNFDWSLADHVGIYIHDNWFDSVGFYLNNWVTKVREMTLIIVK